MNPMGTNGGRIDAIVDRANVSKRDTSRITMPTEKSVKIDLGPMPMGPGSNLNGMKANGNEEKEEAMTVLCINLTALPSGVKFLVCAGGVFIFYLVYGYFQELIFRLEGFKPYGWYLTLIQFAFYSFFGMVETRIKGDNTRKIPLKTYMLIAFLTVATMGLSNSSLGYLNYPIQVIFKCCKLIPVLIGGIIIQGKKFSPIDYTACVLMSAGLIFFTLADSQVQPTFSLYGIILISLALCADAVIGNVQEKAMKAHGSSNCEVVLYSYSIGFVYILLGQVVTGQIFPAFTFCLQYPVRTYGYAFIFSLTGYLGVNFVLNLVKAYGALIAVTVTTCRKALTIVISFLFFAKPFTVQYIWSGLIVVIAIFLNVYSKNKAKWDTMLKEMYERYVLGRRTIKVLPAGSIV